MPSLQTLSEKTETLASASEDFGYGLWPGPNTYPGTLGPPDAGGIGAYPGVYGVIAFVPLSESTVTLTVLSED